MEICSAKQGVQHSVRHCVRRALRVPVHLGMGLSAASAVASAAAMSAPFPAVFELSSLNGSNGFILHGIAEGDVSGYSVSAAGDVNGDGFADLIVGAETADAAGKEDAGEVYVVFGGAMVGASGGLELSELDGGNGFVLVGVRPEDNAGSSVSGAGDVNGDGYDDLLVGAWKADPHGHIDAGQSYVVFGGPEVGASGSFDLNDLDGYNGFALSGTHLIGECGAAVSRAGDWNGDGYDDVITGANWADPGLRGQAGQSYVVFGGPRPVLQGELTPPLLDGNRGVVINGIKSQDFSGRSVGDAGDVNGDGFNDLVIGAIGADPDGQEDAGEAYVLFGHSPPFAGRFELSELDGTNGLVVACSTRLLPCGVSVSGTGDVNDDGYGDFIVGAPGVRPHDLAYAGVSYVVFGGPELGSSGRLRVSELDGTNGFALNGGEANAWTGWQVGRAGDLNGDGIDDIAIGATYGDPPGRTNAGKTYVVFGAAGLGAGATLELAALDGSNGFVLHGIDAGDRAGTSTRSAGDVNGDDVDDLLIGAPLAYANDLMWSGESYLVFGRATDTDSDGIPNRADNCTAHANPDQRDTNGDGYGNLCDPDLDGDGIVNFADLGEIKLAFYSADPDADFDGDGNVNFADLGTLKAFFFLPPGPSGIVDNQRRAQRAAAMKGR